MMCGVYGLDFLACWLFKWKVFYRGFDENVQYTMTKWQFCCFFCFSTRSKFTQLIQCEELPPKGQGNFLKFSSSKNARLAFECNSNHYCNQNCKKHKKNRSDALGEKMFDFGWIMYTDWFELYTVVYHLAELLSNRRCQQRLCRSGVARIRSFYFSYFGLPVFRHLCNWNFSAVHHENDLL